jgi:hypothetical protein
MGVHMAQCYLTIDADGCPTLLLASTDHKDANTYPMHDSTITITSYLFVFVLRQTVTPIPRRMDFSGYQSLVIGALLSNMGQEMIT